ncbi:unnamed protein product [Tenebrio molitor]|nr:unnamed protein product [Tenebrio molitor]
MTAHDEVELGEEFFCSVLPVVTDRRLHKLRRKINRLFEKAENQITEWNRVTNRKKKQQRTDKTLSEKIKIKYLVLFICI